MSTAERNLKNQVALVSGASSGIGRAIALALGSEGAEVCLVGRRREILAEVAELVSNRGGSARVCSCDLLREEHLRALAHRVETEFGRLDLLILAAGTISYGAAAEASLADLDLQYAVNVRAPYVLTQLTLPLIRKACGQIVFINSSAGLAASANTGQYSATKHALRAVANSLRDEVNPDGVRVLSVYPGRTATPMMAAFYAKEGRLYRPELLLQPEDIAAMVTHALKLPTTAEVTEISIRPLRKTY